MVVKEDLERFRDSLRLPSGVRKQTWRLRPASRASPKKEKAGRTKQSPQAVDESGLLILPPKEQ